MPPPLIALADDMTQNASPLPWGFTLPDCRGANALLHFMNDLARVVNQYLGHGKLSEEALADAQKAEEAGETDDADASGEACEDNDKDGKED